MKYKDIAVIGMSGRFAKADTLAEFREILVKGEDCISTLSEKRRHLLGLPLENKYIEIGELYDIDCFDHEFFGISSKEADYMSPEQRIALELAAESVLNAGYSLEQFKGSNCGVFISCSEITYHSNRKIDTSLSVLGSMKMMLSAEIAYHLDLRGYNMVYDSGCSSSLLAIHDACIKLSINEIDTALVGGISLFTDIYEKKKNKYDVLGLLSKEYRSRAFDDEADGTSAGEGAAFVLLKPLEKALEDKDPVLGVIKSGAVNGDGARCSKLTMPSPEAQKGVINTAWRDADISCLSEIEAHGIGNKIGDSVEAQSLLENIAEYNLQSNEILLSSVKTNVGHLYETSGLAGLVKVLTGFSYREAYPLVHYEKENSLIDFASAKVVPLQEVRHFSKKQKRAAAIDSFGLGGTNAHIVVENYVDKQDSEQTEDIACLMKVSAKTEDAFYGNCSRFIREMNEREIDYKTAVYTMNAARDDYPVRRLVHGSCRKDLLEKVDMMRPAGKAEDVKLVYILKQQKKQELDTQKFAEIFPGIEMDKTSFSQNSDLDFKAAAYRYLTDCNIKPDYVLADQLGKQILKYVSGEISKDALMEAEQRDTDDNYEKIVHQVNKLAKKSKLIIVDFGCEKTIKDLLWRSGIRVLEMADPWDMITLFEEHYNSGKDINWKKFYGGQERERAALPGYAFAKTAHWIVPEKRTEEVKTAEPKPIETKQTEKEPAESKPIESEHSVFSLDKISKFLEKLWMKILNFSDAIEYDEDFFYLGGNSLLIEMMAEPINKEFNLDFDIYQIYENETIEKLSACIMDACEQA